MFVIILVMKLRFSPVSWENL